MRLEYFPPCRLGTLEYLRGDSDLPSLSGRVPLSLHSTLASSGLEILQINFIINLNLPVDALNERALSANLKK